MDIKFVNKALCVRCNEEDVMVSTYGEACSAALMRRLIQLYAAEFLGVFFPPDSPPLFFCFVRKYDLWLVQVSLNDGYIMLLEPENKQFQRNGSTLNLTETTKIIIHSVEKTDGK